MDPFRIPGARPPEYENIDEMVLKAIESFVTPPPSVKLPQWELFNRLTGGLRSKEFSIICGGTGVGKTTWLACLSANLLRANVPHFVMSVETGPVDYMRRVLCVLTGQDWNNGDSIPAHIVQEQITKILPQISKPLIKFSLYENRIPLEQLLGDLEYMYKTYQCQVAIIDNLNFFLEVTRSSDQLIEMDRVVHEIIMFCKRHEIHIFMVMHPRKTDGGQILSEFDIKGSSTAVQEAQNVFLLNRPSEEQIQNDPRLTRNHRLVTIAKMRRKGKNVGRSIVYSSNGTSYVECNLMEYGQ